MVDILAVERYERRPVMGNKMNIDENDGAKTFSFPNTRWGKVRRLEPHEQTLEIRI